MNCIPLGVLIALLIISLGVGGLLGAAAATNSEIMRLSQHIRNESTNDNLAISKKAILDLERRERRTREQDRH